jgi:hypothetical protein
LDRRHPQRRTGGLAWFAAIVAGWTAFWALALASDATLADLWHGVRDLPALVEALVWLAAFPFVLALGIWDAGWEPSTRAALVAACTVAWSLAFWPWRRAR